MRLFENLALGQGTVYNADINETRSGCLFYRGCMRSLQQGKISGLAAL